MLGPSAHVDTFCRDNLPAPEDQPDYLLDAFPYPDHMNAAYELTDRMVEKGFGDRVALVGQGRSRTYAELAQWSSQIARALVEDYGIKPGHRILIRSANTPALVACWLGATKAGAVVINTMPMMRKKELMQYLDKAQVQLALCDLRMLDELEACLGDSATLEHVVSFDGTAGFNGALDHMAARQSTEPFWVKTGRDDVALLGFTSGSTGVPKATMHFHRDLLVIADAYAKEVLNVQPDDIFVGSPPLAFTFGLGGLAIFPLRFGASAVLLEQAGPAQLIEIIERHKATICFTAPTAYRAMLLAMEEGADLSSLRCAVSAGETLPPPVFDAWVNKTGREILDGIGGTELLHIYISNRFGSAQPGSTGTPLTGYIAKIVDDEMNEVPRGTPGHLAVKGPVGCRYLEDARQTTFVRDGWNLPGDIFTQDEAGAFHFASRSDDMIVSSGYNIAGPEVESALLAHPDVLECGVIGVPDEARGAIVQAHVVLRDGVAANESTAMELQEFVKATVAPYKYPRSVIFTTALPKTESGKIQRFRLKQSEDCAGAIHSE
ncbi:MAG: AMP-binding protein [Alphaproteobacteria bacterium]|nr:AMP-binding protein [Alphaproteobacteria bacterium]MBU1281310.1 AMP-binding protein [Alphaproteobacteria bacterium]MBU1571685.1 AMP-binding protein [Alphaproteobacteria bacterium]MBU1830660.1 AMP-binding protein [Alphaproteobacteria bacterium]MBU2076410.1 AMP-binding protein [Alphaproteobacteria bacterium]